MSRRRKLIALALVATVLTRAAVAVETRNESRLSKFVEGLNDIWKKVKELNSANNEDIHEIDKHRTAISLLNLGNAILDMTDAKERLIIYISNHDPDYVTPWDDPNVEAVKVLIECVRTKVRDLAPLISSFQELEAGKLVTTLYAGLTEKTVKMNDLVSQNGIEKRQERITSAPYYAKQGKRVMSLRTYISQQRRGRIFLTNTL